MKTLKEGALHFFCLPAYVNLCQKKKNHYAFSSILTDTRLKDYSVKQKQTADISLS